LYLHDVSTLTNMLKLLDTGNVYVWGYGILGLGPEVQKILKPTMIPSALFGNNVYNQNIRVIKII